MTQFCPSVLVSGWGCFPAHTWVTATDVFFCKSRGQNHREQPRWQKPHWCLAVLLTIAARTPLYLYFPFWRLPSRPQRLTLQPAPDVESCSDRKISPFLGAPCLPLMPMLLRSSTSSMELCIRLLQMNFPWCFQSLPSQKSHQMSLSASGRLDTAIAPSTPPSGCQAEVLEQALLSAPRTETFPMLPEFSDVCPRT